MRLVFTTLFALFTCAILTAQINDESPFPVDFVVESPASAAGVYDYATQAGNADSPIWGPTLYQSLSGELEWARNATDSLACEAVETDLTGKIAFIRRGGCEFGLKALNAQNAGAIAFVIVNHYDNPDDTGATVFGMLGGESGADVTIPGVFVSRSTGEIISAALDNGETVSVLFDVKSFYNPISSYSYQTPASEAVDFSNFSIQYVNADSVNEVTLMASTTITAPSGAEETLNGMKVIPAVTADTVFIDGSYTATEMGEHNITWTHNQSDEVTTSKFLMTEHTYSVASDGELISLGPSDDDFVNMHNLSYQVGGLVATDSDGASATYASFGIANAEALYTDNPEADRVSVILYDGDPDEDGKVNFADGADGSFDDLSPVAFGDYLITGNEPADDFVYVQLEDLATGDNVVDLKPNGMYYIVIAYDGINAGTGIAPRFLGTQGNNYLSDPPSTPLRLNNFYARGWNGSTVAVRLHIEGFVAPVSTEDIVSLDLAKIALAPNPVSDILTVSFDLDENANKVNAGLVDVNGKVIQSYEFNNIHKNNVSLDLSEVPSGVYFLSVYTPEGYRALKVTKIK